MSWLYRLLHYGVVGLLALLAVYSGLLAYLRPEDHSAFGKFSGEPVVRLLSDGRNIELLEPFSYTSAAGTLWKVPPGSIVDGASIPKAFWGVVGTPLVGKYRDATIIHDRYCDTRARDWEETHWVFFEGMLARGVPRDHAELLVAGVFVGGPRWEFAKKAFYRDRPPIPVVMNYEPVPQPDDLEQIEAKINAGVPVEQIVREVKLRRLRTDRLTTVIPMEPRTP